MRKSRMNKGWSFRKDDPGKDWVPVDLPHDAMIYEEREPKCINAYNTGYYPGGVYLYEKNLGSRGWPHAVVEFEGVFGDTTVFLNGTELVY